MLSKDTYSLSDIDNTALEEDLARTLEDDDQQYCSFGVCVDALQMIKNNGNDDVLNFCAPCLRVQNEKVCNTPIDYMIETNASMTCKTFLQAVHAKIDMNK